jgi:hypothetical protein
VSGASPRAPRGSTGSVATASLVVGASSLDLGEEAFESRLLLTRAGSFAESLFVFVDERFGLRRRILGASPFMCLASR